MKINTRRKQQLFLSDHALPFLVQQWTLQMYLGGVVGQQRRGAVERLDFDGVEGVLGDVFTMDCLDEFGSLIPQKSCLARQASSQGASKAKPPHSKALGRQHPAAGR